MKLNLYIFLLWLLGIQVLCAQTTPVQPSVDKATQYAEDTVLVRLKWYKNLEILSAPEMLGRGYTGNGHVLAAKYIANQLQKKTYFKPLNNDYLQYFNFQINNIKGCEFIINGKKIKIGVEYIPNPDIPTISDLKAKTVLVHYGTPEDYRKQNLSKLQNKIFIIRSGLPTNHTYTEVQKKEYNSDDAKIRLAQVNGAAGVILLKDKLTHTFAPEQIKIPVLQVLFSEAEPPATEPISQLLTDKSFSVELKAEAEIVKQKSQNVLGMIQGSQYPDSFIFLTAHYDHLGVIYGLKSTSATSKKSPKTPKNYVEHALLDSSEAAVFYGANDNASGVSFLLSMADHFSLNYDKHPPKYSIVFMACGAEEAGLHGSMFFTHKQPLVDLSKIKIVLNFDLMGNGENGVMTVAGKTFTQEFEKLTHLNNSQKYISPLLARPNASNSDHYSFTQKKVPAFFFYTQGGAKPYHDVFDVASNLKAPILLRFRQLMIDYIRSF